MKKFSLSELGQMGYHICFDVPPIIKNEIRLYRCPINYGGFYVLKKDDKYFLAIEHFNHKNFSVRYSIVVELGTYTW